LSLKELAKIGKSLIRQLSSAIERYEILDSTSSQAHVCPFANVEDEKLRKKLCELNCPDTQITEAHSKISVYHKRLSKLQILQLLYYHFLPIDSRGVVVSISEKQVAEKLGCTVRTVRNNNAVLENLGIIYYSNSGEGRFNVMILPYKTYHATKEEGGSGYLNMSKEYFTLLLQINNVNALRMELRKLLVYDNDTAKRTYKKSEVSYISKNDWKMFLPKYTHSERMLQTIAESGTKAFKTTTEHATVYFVMDSRYNGKILKEQKEKLYLETLSKELSTHFSFIEKKHLVDLVQLCFEYSFTEVVEAVQQWMGECSLDPDKKRIVNVGGYIRTLVRKNRMEKQLKAPSVQISA
jgi:hypothetical protein